MGSPIRGQGVRRTERQELAPFTVSVGCGSERLRQHSPDFAIGFSNPADRFGFTQLRYSQAHF